MINLQLSIVSDDPNAAADDVALIKRSGTFGLLFLLHVYHCLFDVVGFNLLLSNCEPSHDL